MRRRTPTNRSAFLALGTLSCITMRLMSVAENAAEYLGKGSHVNIVGRVRNNNYEKDGEEIYGLAFTAEEVDYLDSRAESEARRGRGDGPEGTPRRDGAEGSASSSASRSRTSRNERQAADA